MCDPTTHGQQLYQELLLHSYGEAFDAVNAGNGYFIPVSQFTGEKFVKKMLVRNLDLSLSLHDICQTGGNSFKLENVDQFIQNMNIFKRPHIPYNEIIFTVPCQRMIYADLYKHEAFEVSFVSYQQNDFSRTISIIISGTAKILHCYSYGSEWICFPVK